MKIIIYLLLSINIVFASIGNITSVIGEATVTRGNLVSQAVVGFSLESKDIIKTSVNSKVRIRLNDDSLISLGQKSALSIDNYIFDANNPQLGESNLNFFDGAFKSVTGKIGKINPQRVKLKTKSANIGIRGTTIVGNQTTIACTEGMITVSSLEGQEVVVTVGQITDTLANQAPTMPRNYESTEIKTIEKELEPQNKSDSLTFKTQNSVSKDAKVTAKSQNGTVVVNKDNSVTYKPKEGFKGNDTVVVESTKNGVTTVEIIEITSGESLDLNLKSVSDNLSDLSLNKTLTNSLTSSYDSELTKTSEEKVTQTVKKINEDVKKTTTTQGTFETTLNGALSMSGKAIYFETTNNTINGSKNMSVDINKNTGYINGIINNSLTYGISGDKTSSYYLNDDNFASIGDNSRFTQNSTHTLSKDSYIKAISDGLDSSGNSKNIDDESSWGYWMADVTSNNDNSNVQAIGTFVVGNETPTNVIQNYINNNSDFTFKGHMIGNVLKSGSAMDSILLDTNNNLTLNLDFGSSTNSFNGTFNFNTQSGQNWNGSINNGVLTLDGFSSSNNIIGSGSGNSITNSSINGDYFGTSELKSVGGDFTMETQNSTAYGSFKADKQ